MDELGLSDEFKQTVRQQLIPAFYLREAATKAPRADQRKTIEEVVQRLLEPLRNDLLFQFNPFLQRQPDEATIKVLVEAYDQLNF
ncbi:hypothetical protein CCP3SC1_10060 [Gammaproteobacteria bacterium]